MSTPKKRLTHIDRLRNQRTKAIQLLMVEHDLTVDDLVEESGLSIGSVYNTIQGRFTSPIVLSILTRRIGPKFDRVYFDYPNHAA